MHSGSAVLIGTLGGDMSSKVPTVLGTLAPVGTPYERSHPTVWSGLLGERQSACGLVGVRCGFLGPAPISAPSMGLLVPLTVQDAHRGMLWIKLWASLHLSITVTGVCTGSLPASSLKESAALCSKRDS